MLIKLYRRIEAFWLDSEANTQLVIFHRGYCLLIAWQILLVLLPSVSLLLSDRAPLRITPHLAEIHKWNLFAYLPGVIWIRVGLCAIVLSLALSLKRAWYRPMMLLSWCLLISVHDLSPAVFFSNDKALRYFGLCLIFAPIGPSSDHEEFWNSSSHASIVLRLIQVEYAMIWTGAWFFKIWSPKWRSGEALWFVLQSESRVSSFSRALIAHIYSAIQSNSLAANQIEIPLIEWISRGATWGVLLAEFFLSWGLFLKPTRRYALIIGFALHVLILLFMNVDIFQAMMLLGLLTFINWRRINPSASLAGATPTTTRA